MARLRGLKIATPELLPYGLGATPEETCSPVITPGRQIRVCVRKPARPGPTVKHKDDVCRFLGEAVNADRESFYVLHLDVKNRVMGIEEAARGTVSSVETTPREIFKSAILTNAAAIILAHNHPSGAADPSPADADITRRIISAGNLLGIPVRDHVIVAREGCTSLRETMGARLEFHGAKSRPAREMRRRRRQ